MVAISVIVPVHNGEKYLHKCLDSLLNGTFQDMEVIVVENASTDSTLAICREYEARYENVRVLTTDIPGLSHARNMGMDVAQGAYLAFVDADDYVSPYIYEHMYACAMEQDSDFVVCDYKWGTETDYQFPVENKAVEKINMSDYIYLLYMKSLHVYSVAWNKLLRSDLAQDIRFDESLIYFEDRNWVQRVVCRTRNICHLKETLNYYRKNDDSISRSSNERARMYQIYSLQKDLDFFKREFPDKTIWQEYVTTCLMQNADVCLKRAKKKGEKEIEVELKPIIKEATKQVRKAKYLSRRDKFRFLLEHDCPPLFKLAAKITGH